MPSRRSSTARASSRRWRRLASRPSASLTSSIARMPPLDVVYRAGTACRPWGALRVGWSHQDGPRWTERLCAAVSLECQRQLSADERADRGHCAGGEAGAGLTAPGAPRRTRGVRCCCGVRIDADRRRLHVLVDQLAHVGVLQDDRDLDAAVALVGGFGLAPGRAGGTRRRRWRRRSSRTSARGSGFALNT